MRITMAFLQKRKIPLLQSGIPPQFFILHSSFSKKASRTFIREAIFMLFGLWVGGLKNAVKKFACSLFLGI